MNLPLLKRKYRCRDSVSCNWQRGEISWGNSDPQLGMDDITKFGASAEYFGAGLCAKYFDIPF